MENNITTELNLEQKVTIKSIAPWSTGFRRIESNGDVTIPPNGTVRLTRSEIIAQVQNGNRLLSGTDDRGSHATLFIDDLQTRKEVDFETDENTQEVLTEKKVKTLFGYKTLKSFKKNLKNLVMTRAEKYAIMQMIKKAKFNDFEKIREVEHYTGLSL